jgi:hypothetical protein
MLFPAFIIFGKKLSRHSMEAEKINKENIKEQVRFVHADVLSTRQERDERKRKLEQAMLLGNSYKGKIKIIFSTEEGDREVETTVWATTDSSVQLKGDVSIPIHAIRDVVI